MKLSSVRAAVRGQTFTREPECADESNSRGTAFNAEKFEPKEFGSYYLARSTSADKADVPKLKKEAILICGLDAKFPVPLMTKTLGKISEVGRTDFNLLDDREQEAALSDLEHLLVTEFPDTELPAPTRVTFAATKIAFLAASREQPVAKMAELVRARFHLGRRLAEITERLRSCARRSSLAEQLRNERKRAPASSGFPEDKLGPHESIALIGAGASGG